SANYDNSQTCSESFNRYVDTLVRDLVEIHGVRNCRVVEVGCGNGAFLKKLIEYPDAGNRGIGFDLSYRGPATDLDGRAQFWRSHHDRRVGQALADMGICHDVIEHV